ncbi:type II toxin-antitoxin system ParD family antitoxin [Fulvivirga maritima]|uniref:ribbon-helix-helix domain-containing protein n=1 Tax=Fulvivirga maritima TaxID=2904247 RepID=UPI001F21A62E|nr:type II toxin-antitoxin system ParD family antitoxin [Fulvivirga maritima]UII27417.1 type II toxin-antitoxin system ParD family antitoxin [Fulvivirga maritima]
MARQSITFTEPNDKWLKAQIESKEYTSKSELVNDLIRKARAEEEKKLDWLRKKLIEAEQSGFTKMNRDEILALSKDELHQNGEL